MGEKFQWATYRVYTLLSFYYSLGCNVSVKLHLRHKRTDRLTIGPSLTKNQTDKLQELILVYFSLKM